MPLSNKVQLLDKGYVQLVDMMGDDGAIVDAARVSVKGLPAVSSDRKLIRHLMRSRHSSPFEHVELKFNVRCPIFVERQWFKHRTFSANSISGRYTELPRDAYLPEEPRLKVQSSHNKQGSSDLVVDNTSEIREIMESEQEAAFANYDYYLDCDLTRELARINLPLATYTEFIWKGNLHNFFHFTGLRAESHAQEEIQVYAKAMLELVRDTGRVNFAIEAFEDYRMYAKDFSRMELEALKAAVSLLPEDTVKVIAEQLSLKGRELREFTAKLGL